MNSLKGLAAVGIAIWLMFLGGCEAIQVTTKQMQNGALIAMPTVAALSAPAPTQRPIDRFISSDPVAPPPIIVTVIVPAPTTASVPGDLLAEPTSTPIAPAEAQTGPKIIVIKNGNNPAAAPIVVTDGTKRKSARP